MQKHYSAAVRDKNNHLPPTPPAKISGFGLPLLAFMVLAIVAIIGGTS